MTKESDAAPNDSDAVHDAVLLTLKHQEERIARLEDESAHKGLVKKLTASAGTMALFLGLVLTFQSLYDVFVRKPEADRISRVSQFNQAVNSVAKTQQDELRLVAETPDRAMQLTIQSMAVPQILSDLATARAMLPDLDDKDVGIPQLIILIGAAVTEGDMASAYNFVTRAVSKSDVTPYLHAEAKRYEGKYWFLSGDPGRGRQSYEDAIATLTSAPAMAANRAFVLSELVMLESFAGVCDKAVTDLGEFVASLKSPYVTEDARLQMSAAMKAQLGPPRQRCAPEFSLDALAAN